MNQFEIKNLVLEFDDQQDATAAVDRVNITLKKGEILGFVGESGSGKSLTMLAALGLLNRRDCRLSGSVFFENNDITPAYDLNQKKYRTLMREILGNRIAVAFQDASTALSSLVRIDRQLLDGVYAHKKITKAKALEQIYTGLRCVGIEEPQLYLKRYPHELSGGMRQRVMIAMALMNHPALLIADEPTASLDAIHQRQIINLLKKENQSGMSMIFITHDLSIVASLCHRVCILYGGCIVEEGTTNDIFSHAKHPYTKQLLACIAYMEEADEMVLPKMKMLNQEQIQSMGGCVFLNACTHAMNICKINRPPRIEMTATQNCYCWLYDSKRLEQGYSV